MKAIIIGASGGIGSAIVDQLLNSNETVQVIGVAREATKIDRADPRWTPVDMDLMSEPSIEQGISKALGFSDPDLVLIATGFLSQAGGIQPERSFKQQSQSSFEHVFAINTFGPALIAKYLLPQLPRKQRAIVGFLSARVGSISDNRLGGWHAYRASKAALNMLIRNYSIELAMRKSGVICIGLHPGTVDTKLSEPFQKNLPDGQVITPAMSAEHLLSVCAGVTLTDSGKVFDWKGAEIPA